jgi:hypothetical protein
MNTLKRLQWLYEAAWKCTRAGCLNRGDARIAVGPCGILGAPFHHTSQCQATLPVGMLNILRWLAACSNTEHMFWEHRPAWLSCWHRPNLPAHWTGRTSSHPQACQAQAQGAAAAAGRLGRRARAGRPAAAGCCHSRPPASHPAPSASHEAPYHLRTHRHSNNSLLAPW